MIKSISKLIDQGITPLFDTRLKANRVEYLLARHQGVQVARRGLGPASVAGKLGERLGGGMADRLLLGEQQALVLWEQVIAQSPHSDALLDTGSVARWAREAAGLAADYRLPLSRLGQEAAAETRAVATWWRAVDEVQTANGWLDPRGLLAAADRAVQAGSLDVKGCAWLDRDVGHPVALSLAKRMHSTGASSVELGLGDGEFHVYPDPMEELRAAAAWGYATLSQDTTGQVVIVVPGLARRIQDVQQAFADLACGGAPQPFIALGTPLSAQVSIRAAFALVELVLGNRSFAVASTILRAANICRGEELAGRALLERYLRERPDGQFWLLSAAGVKGLDPSQSGLTQRFEKALEKLSAARPGPGHRATPMQWANDIRRWLRLAGWYAGSSTLDQVWNEVLMRLASLGFNGAQYTNAGLLAALRREIAAAHVPSVMGPLEVVGRIDDVGPGCEHVWLTGMTETQYPHLPKANPMLPLAMQRALGIAAASATGRAHHASAALARVRALAREVVLSLPQSLQDAPTSPHPVLAGCPPRTMTAVTVGRARTALDAVSSSEVLLDPVPPLRTALKRGGSRALAQQARCPALAFFEVRLGAQLLEQPQAGVRRQDQGRWAHQICERLFKQLPSSEVLKATDEPGRRELINGLVDDVLRIPLSRAHGAYRAALDVEHRLLQQRMLTLLEHESRRSAFEVIAREERRQQDIGPLPVTLRLDRVDRLASGELAVLDYKTGATPRLSDWLEAPLRDVQLPLYVLSFGTGVGAALFVQTHPQAARYQGVWPKGAFPNPPRPVADWSQLQSLWRQELERLAGDFAAGQGWHGAEPKLMEGAWVPLTRIYAATTDADSTP